MLLPIVESLGRLPSKLGREDRKQLKTSIDETTRRRNDIVHRADRSQDDPADQQEIGYPWAKQAVETIRDRLPCPRRSGDGQDGRTEDTSSGAHKQGGTEMDQEIRNKLRNVVTQCRKLLEDSISQELEGQFGIFAKKDQVTADPTPR